MFHTSIHFDTESGEFVRRDVALDVWEEELKERTPLAYWRTTYAKPDSGKPKVEMSSKESPETLLRRLIDEDEEHTEHARYILGLMLERKKQLVPRETKYTEQGTLLLYEHRKSGEVFIIRDPELRLDEIESVQEEVATLLGFGGPVVEAAKIAGVTLTPDGKIEKKGEAETTEPEKKENEAEPAKSEAEGEAQTETAEDSEFELAADELAGDEEPESEENEAEAEDEADLEQGESEDAETAALEGELEETEFEAEAEIEVEAENEAEATSEESASEEAEQEESESESEPGSDEELTPKDTVS
ncbi:hypothetical protein [Roseimicrobium sp. ORNL1]|uniref:hypothetical protein n=1 Tax=Roseimicrobium sp. ORNL1 TaxID=2711231 RepID=UPI0013E1D638|nr:hypothetical protein [Roseimicrobium sp. ORNL1]QIF04156.1 hypothetical protein G5S37_22380 [Roseimicrobium sp. ORNL1]